MAFCLNKRLTLHTDLRPSLTKVKNYEKLKAQALDEDTRKYSGSAHARQDKEKSEIIYRIPPETKTALKTKAINGFSLPCFIWNLEV